MKFNSLKRAASAILASALVVGSMAFTATAAEGDNYDNLATAGAEELVILKGEVLDAEGNLKTQWERQELEALGGKLTVQYTIYGVPEQGEWTAINNLVGTFENGSGLEFDKLEVGAGNAVTFRIEKSVLGTSGADQYSFVAGGINDVTEWIDDLEGIYIRLNAIYNITDMDALAAGGTLPAFTAKVVNNGQGNTILIDANGNDYTPDVDPDSDIKVIPPEITVGTTYSVEYVLGEHTGLESTNIPAKEWLAEDVDCVVAPDATAKYVENDVQWVLKDWTSNIAIGTSGKTTWKNGDEFKMPVAENGLVFTANYAKDQNKNDIPDDEEVTIVFVAGEGVTGFTLPANQPIEGIGSYFKDGDNDAICVAVGGGLAADAAPTPVVDTANNYKEPAKFYVDDAEVDLAEVAKDAAEGDKITVTAKAELNTITATFVDGEWESEEVEVAPDATYTIVDEDGNPLAGKEDLPIAAGQNDISGNQPEKDKDLHPFKEWKVEPIDEDGDGINEAVKISPVFDETKQDKVVVPVPGPAIVNTTEPPTEIDEDDEPVDIELTNGAWLIFENRDGVEIPNSRIEIKEGAQIVYPTAVDQKDDDGNPFDAWVIDGDTANLGDAKAPDDKYDVYYYLATPKYKAPTTFTATKPGETEPAVTEEGVPVGTEYEVVNGDGTPISSGTVEEGGTNATLPTDDQVIPTNADGDYFKGNWETEKDPETGKITVKPVYEALDPEEEIEIITPGEDGQNDATGSGYTILTGKYNKGDNVARATFYVRVLDKPATEADAANFKLKAEYVLGFEGNQKYFDRDTTLGTFAYDGVKTYEGKEYGAFHVDITMTKSAIVKAYMAYKDVETTGYDVILVADVNKNYSVNSRDLTQLIKYVAGDIETPKAAKATGSAGDYQFELLDMNKNGSVNSRDLTALIKMVAGDVTPSN